MSDRYTLRDPAAGILATVTVDPPSIQVVGEHDLGGVADWATHGVPGLAGAEKEGTRYEAPIVVSPEDPLWGLALLEEAERRDWFLVPVREDGIKAVHVREYTKTMPSGKVVHVREHTDKRVKKLTTDVVLNVKDMQMIGGSLGGSTPGAQMKDKNGVVWYVKDVKSSTHARNEVLAGRLYELAGVDVPELQLVKSGDKLFVGSKLVKLQGKASLATPGAAEGFAADAWLANWDVVGKNYDNLLIGPEGQAIRIDVGGSLIFRAQGGLKAETFGPEAEEINSLRNPKGPNSQSSSIFADLHPEDVKQVILDTVAKVTNQQINKVTEQYWGPVSGAGGFSVVALQSQLKARRDWLVALAKGTKESQPAELKPGHVITGKVYSQDSPVFTGGLLQPIFELPMEPKPKLPAGPQMRCMREGSELAGYKYTTDNWDHPGHPRPDRDGVPTNLASMEFQRLFTLGVKMRDAWGGSAQSAEASKLKRAAMRVFNANGIAYGQHGSEVDDEKSRWDNDRVVRMIYRDTQERLAAKGITEHDRILLWRGVKNTVTTAGVLEGHSYSKQIATNFDGHDVVKRWVSPNEILMDNKSAFCEDSGHAGESEWLVFAGGFGSAVTITETGAKASAAAKPAAGGIVNYTAGKPKKTYKSQMVSEKQAASSGEKAEKKWAEITKDTILKVKELHAQGKGYSQISKALGVSPSTAHGIVIGKTKVYAQTGPRTPGMKKLLGGVTESQWATVKKEADAQSKKYGKVDFEAVGKAAGLHSWKAQVIFFTQKKA